MKDCNTAGLSDNARIMMVLLKAGARGRKKKLAKADASLFLKTTACGFGSVWQLMHNAMLELQEQGYVKSFGISRNEWIVIATWGRREA